jgi:RNA polymerase sigma factor (sigma-70 family)
MTRLAEQDRFLALLEEHKRILYKVANAYCRNRLDRPDLIQEIILELWRSFGRFDGRARFSTWMYRIAMNVAISAYRGERRRIRDALPLDELGLNLEAADRAMEGASDDIRLLHQLIRGLDELSRALIVLLLDGYGHDEIAEIVGISTSNVATRLHRIKQKLQREADALQSEPTRRSP